MGLLLIVCGPSGVGKTSLRRILCARHPELVLSTSYTTRQPRAGETDGVDYHFVTQDVFHQMRERGDFAEWAKVHGNFYATAKRTIHEAWDQGQHIFFDIDYQGAVSLHATYPSESVLVLVVPPDLGALEARLRSRATDDEVIIAKRLAGAKHELEQYALFEFVIFNHVVEEAADLLDYIYRAAKLRTELHRPALDALLAATP